MTEDVIEAVMDLTSVVREVDAEHMRAYASQLYNHAAVTMDAAGDDTTGMYWSAVVTARFARLLEAIAEDDEP